MNSINIDPSDGNLIISSRNLWQIYKVDRSTGARCGASAGALEFEIEPRAKFAFQHHVTPHGGGVYTIFDNEAGPPAEATQSRALVVAVDEERRTVRFRSRVPPRRPLAVAGARFGGGTRRRRRIRRLGRLSWFTEWDRDGAVVLDARMPPGIHSYRAFLDRWHGMPEQPPEFVVHRTGGRSTLYVSWNGATVHRRGRVRRYEQGALVGTGGCGRRRVRDRGPA